MELYVVTQPSDGYDLFESMVVAAENEQAARIIHPDGSNITHSADGEWQGEYDTSTHGRWSADVDEYAADRWVKAKDIDKLEVEHIGATTREAGVVHTSYNAA